MRVPITVTVAFGNTISIAHRDAIANAIGDAIGAPVRVTFATAIGDTYSDPERISDPDYDPDVGADLDPDAAYRAEQADGSTV